MKTNIPSKHIYINTHTAWIYWGKRLSKTSFIRHAKKAGVRYAMGPTIWVGYCWCLRDLIDFGFVSKGRIPEEKEHEKK